MAARSFPGAMPWLLHEFEGFAEDGGLGGDDDVRGELEDGGVADFADVLDLFGCGLEGGAHGFESIGISTDVVDELACPGGVFGAVETGSRERRRRLPGRCWQPWRWLLGKLWSY